ncbi:hypothetical protein Tco_0969887 [Tanacetum coccineum]
MLDMARDPCPWEIEMPDPRCERVSFLTRPKLREIILVGRCAPVMMLHWLHFGSLRVGIVAAVRTYKCALFFSPQPIEYPTLLLKTLAIGDGLQECLLQCFILGSVRAVGVLDSE